MDDLEKIGDFLDNVLQGKQYKAIEALQRDKDRELAAKIDQLGQLYNLSQKLESDLIEARKTLQRNEGRLTEEERKLQTAILELQKDIKDKPFEHAYQVQRERHESVVLQIQAIRKNLAEVKDGVDAGTKFARENLKVLQESIPTVKRIVITASTKAIAKNEPLTFDIEGRWKGLPVHARVEWAPGWNVPELYSIIGQKMVENSGKL